MAKKYTLAQGQFDRGYLSGLEDVRRFLNNKREPLLREILSGSDISKEEDSLLSVISEIIEEMERLKQQLANQYKET